MAENEDASYHGLARSKRRDAKRQRRKKMVVTGRGVFTINRLLGERAQKAREGQDGTAEIPFPRREGAGG
ncbi:MAG TPA: hypothetical protein VFZ25_11010 [Chloroflexota bacterium]|nr:hypothetical protein [Chloroflexota bacterium]